MKNEFDITWDFLKKEQEEDKLTTNQLHLIIQTLTAYLSDQELKELQNLFNLFEDNKMKKLIDTTKDFRIEYQDKDKNELFLSIVTAVNLEDATDYANKLMAETKLNDLYTFVITEL